VATPARSGFPTGFVAVLVVTCLLFVITAETVANSRSSGRHFLAILRADAISCSSAGS